MKNLILLITFLISFSATAQNWAPSGAVWYYNFQSFSNEGYQKIEYIGDTVFEGQTCKKLQRSMHYRDLSAGTNYDYVMDTVLTYEDNNRVYYYNPATNQFELLYNFNLTSNDQWNVIGLDWDCEGYGVQIVDSVATVDINGFELLKQYTHHTDTSVWALDYEIIERIGSDVDLFPNPLCIVFKSSGERSLPNTVGLRCYYDDEIGWYHRSPVDCDYITEVNSIQKENGFQIFPNPARDSFVIKGKAGSRVLIRNVAGVLVKDFYLVNTKTVSSTFGLGKGVYFITVGSDFKKLIVE